MVSAAPSTGVNVGFDHGTEDPKIDDYATNLDPLIEALVNLKSNATSGSKNLFIELETIRRSALDKITGTYRKEYESILSSNAVTGAQKKELFAKLKQATNETLSAINYAILREKNNARTLISSLESNDMIWEIKGILLNASIHQNETSTKLHELSSNVRIDVFEQYKRFEETMNEIEAQFRLPNNIICSTPSPSKQIKNAPLVMDKVWS